MPYKIKHIGEISRVEYSGVLTANDVSSSLNELYRYEANIEASTKRLVTLAGVTDFQLSYSKLDPVARRRIQQDKVRSVMTAIVATRPIEYGLARMWKSLAENPNLKCEIFVSEQEAQGWLKEEKCSKPPNKSSEPTPTPVTPPAAQEPRQP